MTSARKKNKAGWVDKEWVLKRWETVTPSDVTKSIKHLLPYNSGSFTTGIFYPQKANMYTLKNKIEKS